MEAISLISVGACSEGPWPLWQLEADAKPSKSWPTDDLSGYYSTLTGAEQEAAKIFCEAEGHLNEDEDDEAAMEKALTAVSAFKKLDNSRGIADAVRLVIHVYRARCHAPGYAKSFAYKHDIKDNLRDAGKLATKELEAFRAASDRRGEAVMLLSQAEIAFESGSQKEALKLAAEASGMFHEVSDSKMEAVAQLVLSNMYFRGRSAKEALTSATEARSIFSRLCDRRGEAKSFHASALAHVLAYNVKDGLAMANEALTLFRDLQMQKLEAMELHTIAKWMLAGERLREALPAAKEALALFEDTNYGKGWQASALRIVVEVYLARHETGAALRVALRVLERCRQLEPKDGKSEMLLQDALAHVRLARNEPEEAVAACDEAWAFVQNDGRDKDLTALVMQTWAKVSYRLTGSSVEASQNYLAAAAVAEKAGNVAGQVSCYHGMFGVCMDARDPQGAKEAAGLIQECCRKEKWELGQAAGKIFFARAFALTQAWDNAMAEAAAAQAIFSAQGSSALEAYIMRELAEMHESQNETQKAFEAYSSAQSLFKDATMGSSEASVSVRLARMLLADKDPMKAFVLASKAAEQSKKAFNNLAELGALMVLLQAATHVSADPGSKARGSHVVDQAMKSVKEAGKLCQKFGDKASEGAVAFYHTQLALVQGRGSAKEVLQIANTAITIFEELDDLASQGWVKLLLAQVFNLWGKEHVKKAIEMARDAFSCFNKCGNEDGCRQAMEEMQNLGINFSSLGVDPRSFGASLPSAPTAPPVQDQQTYQEEGQQVDVSDAYVVPAYEKPSLDKIAAMIRPMLEDVASGEEVFLDTSFQDAGIDSLMSTTFRNNCAMTFQVELPATVMFDYPTINVLADYIETNLA